MEDETCQSDNADLESLLDILITNVAVEVITDIGQFNDDIEDYAKFLAKEKE